MFAIKDRQKEIREKGFRFSLNREETTPPTDFSKIKIGLKTIEDVIYSNQTPLRRINPDYMDKEFVLEAINSRNYDVLRDISNFFYETSGIYSRLCRYMATFYRYDWLITPYIESDSISNEKVLDIFYKAINFLDEFNVKMFLGQVALKVMKNGCYYGYIIHNKDSASIQELPPRYCRSRFKKGIRPVVEFNLRYFDEMFLDINQRMRMLKLFPEEFAKAYVLYKKGKLIGDYAGDTNGWYMLDPNFTIKFNMNDEDYPMFASIIPAIIDLDNAQEWDRKKMAQQLLKIIIQKMPIDKNGDLIFDVDEAQQLHANAVQMIGGALGVDVLTTFADVDVADMADKNTTTTVDELQKVERTVYNDAGVSQKQFNSDSNIAMENSILNDEASIYNLLLQFEEFLNYLIDPYNTNKKVNLRVQLLTTTIYNYKEMSKLFKEQVQLGYSKMLPPIALGQSQRSILDNAYFENEILDLNSIFIPPLNTNTMNASMLRDQQIKKSESNQSSDNNEGGRPEKDDREKSTKTMQNIESGRQ